jgi:hypothetical protein
MAEIQRSLGTNPQQEQAFARLKCAHCMSLINCEDLALAVLAELQSGFRIDCRKDGGATEVTKPDLVGAVRAGIDRFLND